MSNRSMASMGDNSHVGVSDLFSDHTLAKRLERTEAYDGAGFVETRARLDPSCGAEWKGPTGRLRRRGFDGSAPWSLLYQPARRAGGGARRSFTRFARSQDRDGAGAGQRDVFVDDYAAEQGCDVAMICSELGTGSQRNSERNGFRIAYMAIGSL